MAEFVNSVMINNSSAFIFTTLECKFIEGEQGTSESLAALLNLPKQHALRWSHLAHDLAQGNINTI